jgi:hypothetical protein
MSIVVSHNFMSIFAQTYDWQYINRVVYCRNLIFWLFLAVDRSLQVLNLRLTLWVVKGRKHLMEYDEISIHLI